MTLANLAASIGALAEPVRRTLYEYVVAQPAPVGREAAAVATGVAVHSAKFHLDRLVEEGLLQVEYRRLGGKTGPGAGRPAKLYSRADREFSVSLPERRYDLVGHVLALAFERAEGGTPLSQALHDAARDEGLELGAATQVNGTDTERLAQTLASQGYEPRPEDDALLLANCPFDSLAREHTALVCGVNHAYVQGVADGLGCDGVQACLDPAAGRCCVTVRARSKGSS